MTVLRREDGSRGEFVGRCRRTNRRTTREEGTVTRDEDRSRDTFSPPRLIEQNFGVCQSKTPQQVDTALTRLRMQESIRNGRNIIPLIRTGDMFSFAHPDSEQPNLRLWRLVKFPFVEDVAVLKEMSKHFDKDVVKVTPEKAFDDVKKQGEIEGLTFDEDQRQLLLLYNRGAKIVAGMPVGFYPRNGYRTLQSLLSLRRRAL